MEKEQITLFLLFNLYFLFFFFITLSRTLTVNFYLIRLFFINRKKLSDPYDQKFAIRILRFILNHKNKNIPQKLELIK